MGKTIKTKGKCKNAYVSTYLIRVVDTYHPKINKEIQKYTKKKIEPTAVMEILAKILEKEPGLIKKHKSILKPYLKATK